MSTMQRYRVRAGKELPHNSALLKGGTIIELPRHVGEDPAVMGFVEPVDADGKPITLPPYDAELDAHPEHEHISILRDRATRANEALREAEDRLTPPAADATVTAPVIAEE